MTKENMQELVRLLNAYLVDHCKDDKLADAIAAVRHRVHGHERKLVGICPWCLEEYRAPHPDCYPGKPKKPREPLFYGEETEDEGADG